MALNNTSKDAITNYDVSESANEDQRSESPKVPVRGRGAWKPTPEPLLPSQVMTLKLEAPKEIEIMRFGVPSFRRRGEGEESDEEEGSESGFGSGELGEARGPGRPGGPTEDSAEVEVRRVKENGLEKTRSKLEQISDYKPRKNIYQSPTRERKPFLMKKQSELPARVQAPKIRVRELSDGPRTPTISSKLKWVTRRPPSPTTPEGRRRATPGSTRSCSGSVISPGSRGSTPTPTLRASRTVRSQTPTGQSVSPRPGSSFRRPSSAFELEHGAPSLSRGSSSRRSAPGPLIPIVPQEHILRLASVLECDPEIAVEERFPPPVPEVASKLEVWNNGMRKEELCPGCRRCVVKFEFVCGDMICGGCYDGLLRESGEGNMRCIACGAIVG